MNVLLIDDEPEILECICSFLSLRGHTSKQFCNPEAAIEAYRREKFDFVIVDFKMPQMNGIEVMQALRADDERAIVILMSGYAEDFREKITKNESLYASFPKPLDFKKLAVSLLEIENELNSSRSSSKVK